MKIMNQKHEKRAAEEQPDQEQIEKEDEISR